MSLSLFRSPTAQDADIQGRANRAWSRPVDLPEEDPSCHLCARHRAMNLRLEDFFNWPINKELPPDTHFGKLSDVLERSSWCNFCRLIAKSVSHEGYRRLVDVVGCWILDGVLEGSHSIGGSDDVASLRLRVVPVMTGWEDAFEPFDVVPLLDATEAHPFSGRAMEEDHFSLPLVKSWVASCNSWHGSQCYGNLGRNLKAEWDVPFIRLLDVEADMIVELSKPGRYVILSYVWGKIPVFKTTRDTLPQLKKEGSLLQHFSNFPATIRDSITMAKLLGIRYLWVDSFCIVQDDPEDQKTQIAAMDQIYSRAYLTIVAAGGEHANSGLPGIHPGSRHVLQHSAMYSESLNLVSILPDASTAADGCKWNTRGWTYQERVLSHRCLIFVNDTVYFQCNKAVWGEDYRAEYPDLVQCASMYNYSLSRSWKQPQMHKKDTYRISHVDTSSFFAEYCKVVAEYTSRDMTYASDRINGVSGILTELTRRSQVRFVSGHPEREFFHASLLWQPMQALRRVPVNPASDMPLFPSWTWAGWIGGVAFIAPSDFNGHQPLGPGEQRTVSCSEIEICYRGPVDFPCLSVTTHSARFRLTVHNRSGKIGELPGLTRFGITYACLDHVDDGSDPEPWLGTILLPKATYRTKLGQEHEFIILSRDYCFSSDELSLFESQDVPTYAVYNVMLIKRLESGVTTEPGEILVERVGVGRMLSTAWENVNKAMEKFVIM
ncbi:heterokaryon incompatibility protein-domain-containing protein [Biscogniauxia sp. FL1348]|nr:heterokaryon incompatibility protein-domain-containing protein [Biscogniauxia sp. FL1348]